MAADHIARVWRSAALLLLALALAGCKVNLYSNLDEQQANEMLAALSGHGIGATKERAENNAWQVMVSEGELAGALDVLRAQGLPHDRYVSMGDVFQKQGLVSTPSEERMRYVYAVSQELSQTLRNVDGVIAARVHVVMPATDPLSDRVRPSSAAVFIKHRPDVDLRLLAPAVKDMVAHSIEGLSHEQVSLSLFEARRAPAPVAPTQQGAAPALDLPRSQAIGLFVLLAAGIACVVALPGLLRRNNLDWRSWLKRNVKLK